MSHETCNYPHGSAWIECCSGQGGNKSSLSTTCLSRNVEVVGELLMQLPAAEVAMEHLLAVLPRIPVVAAAEEILMMGNVPSNYTPYPTAAGSKGNAHPGRRERRSEANEISDEFAADRSRGGSGY